MRLGEIVRAAMLCEAIGDRVLQRYGPRLEQRLERDRMARQLGIDTPDRLVERMVAALPERSGALLDWMASRYVRGDIESVTDFEKVGDYVRRFREYARRGLTTTRDIGRFRSWRKLADEVEAIESRREETKSAVRRRERSEVDRETEILFDDGRWLVLIPRTQRASCFWGKGTRWCISAERSHNYFEQYRKDGPIVFLIDRRSDRKWALVAGTGEFRDTRDDPGNPADIPDHVADVVEQKFPGVWDAVAKWLRGAMVIHIDGYRDLHDLTSRLIEDPAFPLDEYEVEVSHDYTREVDDDVIDMAASLLTGRWANEPSPGRAREVATTLLRIFAGNLDRDWVWDRIRRIVGEDMHHGDMDRVVRYLEAVSEDLHTLWDEAEALVEATRPRPSSHEVYRLVDAVLQADLIRKLGSRYPEEDAAEFAEHMFEATGEPRREWQDDLEELLRRHGIETGEEDG